MLMVLEQEMINAISSDQMWSLQRWSFNILLAVIVMNDKQHTKLLSDL